MTCQMTVTQEKDGVGYGKGATYGDGRDHIEPQRAEKT